MSVQPRKLKNGKISYYITFEFEGRTVWEHAGSDKRVAEGLERRRRQEVRDGTYRPEVKGYVTNATWFDYVWTVRKNRTVENDRQLIDNHVLSLDWFAAMSVQETRPKHILRVVEALRDGDRLGEKSIAIIYGVMRQAYARAEFEEHIEKNPCALPKGTIRWSSSKKNRRTPYTRPEAQLLTTDARINPDQLVWNALAFYTGERMGEVCGRRWRDWDRNTRPLTALSVHSQYDDQPLKTDDEEDVHPRLVPVHPALQAVLESWWATGWELAHRRPPTLDDFIVPTQPRYGSGARTKSSAYDAFQRSLKAVGVTNRTAHATRNTFISVARSGGARPDVIEQITHNAKGTIIDGYTTFEWQPLCDAVLCFSVAPSANLDPIANAAEKTVGPPGFEAGGTRVNLGKGEENGGNSDGPIGPGILAGSGVTGAHFDAAQRRLERLVEVDPDQAGPGLAVCRGVGLAVKMAAGDEAAEADLLAALKEEARRRG
jgi:integrase